MSGRKQEFSRQFHQIIDGVLLVFAFWCAYVVRAFGVKWFGWDNIAAFDEFRWMLFIIMPFGPILLELQGFYISPLLKTPSRFFKQVFRASLWLALLLGGCIIFCRFPVPPRGFVLLFAAFAVIALGLREWITYCRKKAHLKHDHLQEAVILAGTCQDIEALEHSLSPDARAEMRIVARFVLSEESMTPFIKLLHQTAANRVIFAGGHTKMHLLQEAIGICEMEGVEAWLLADFIKTSIARPVFDTLGQHPMMVFRSTPEHSWALLLKGCMDRLGAVILILFLSPLFVAAYIGTRISSPGPVIFKQQRGGRNGRPFTMYKFRTMVVDAEKRQQEIANLNEMNGPVFKAQNDPRVTSFGSWLRRTSIDELPQLFNVVQGHMSLVGPRPLPMYEVEKIENSAQRRRLSVKPGITCLWQVSGRSNVTSFEDWVKLDLDYIDNWSLWLDIKILLKTVPAVLLRHGAR